MKRKSGQAPAQVQSLPPHTTALQQRRAEWSCLISLQGYFLLHCMATMVGLEEFDQFLFEYVQHFREQLVTSEVSPVFIFMA